MATEDKEAEHDLVWRVVEIVEGARLEGAEGENARTALTKLEGAIRTFELQYAQQELKVRMNMLVEAVARCYAAMPKEFSADQLRPLIVESLESNFGVSPTAAELRELVVERSDLRADKGPKGSALVSVAMVGKAILSRWMVSTVRDPEKLALWKKVIDEGEVSNLSSSSVRNYCKDAKQLELPRTIRPYGFVAEMMEAEDKRIELATAESAEESVDDEDLNRTLSRWNPLQRKPE